jgi:hypothetical protein
VSQTTKLHFFKILGCLPQFYAPLHPPQKILGPFNHYSVYWYYGTSVDTMRARSMRTELSYSRYKTKVIALPYFRSIRMLPLSCGDLCLSEAAMSGVRSKCNKVSVYIFIVRYVVSCVRVVNARALEQSSVSHTLYMIHIQKSLYWEPVSRSYTLRSEWDYVKPEMDSILLCLESLCPSPWPKVDFSGSFPTRYYSS